MDEEKKEPEKKESEEKQKTEKQEQKEEKKKTEEKKEPKKEKKEQETHKEQTSQKKINSIEKQTLILMIICGIIIVLFILAFVFKGELQDLYKKISKQEFAYHNLTFTKGYVPDDILVYRTGITLKRSDGLKSFNLFFRNDPRELDKISSTIDRFPKKTLYISFDPELLECEKTALAEAELGLFLDYFEFDANKAITKTNNESNNKSNLDFPVKTCSHSYEDISVFVFQPANETKIYMDETYIKCFRVDINNCETLEAAERIILSMLDMKTGYDPEIGFVQ